MQRRRGEISLTGNKIVRTMKSYILPVLLSLLYLYFNKICGVCIHAYNRSQIIPFSLIFNNKNSQLTILGHRYKKKLSTQTTIYKKNAISLKSKWRYRSCSFRIKNNYKKTKK